jgi:hypothetical protein
VSSTRLQSLDFKDAAADKVGPIVLLTHNADEYKHVTIELNPKNDNLITAV